MVPDVKGNAIHSPYPANRFLQEPFGDRIMLGQVYSFQYYFCHTLFHSPAGYKVAIADVYFVGLLFAAFIHYLVTALGKTTAGW
jgi:hypothetical protein